MTEASVAHEKRGDGGITIHPVWWPIIIQTIGLLLAAFSYTSAMEHRLTTMESNQAMTKDIMIELQKLNAAQDERLRILETTQARILGLEEYAYRGVIPPDRRRP